MFAPQICRILLFAALAAVTLSPCAQAQSAKKQWLVLKNGESLAGEITREADRYLVATDSGSRIYISNEKVNFVADSLDDVYWDHWSRTDPDSAVKQSELFRWCLRHEMTGRAQKVLETIAALPETENSDRSGLMARLAFDLQTAIESKLQKLAKTEISAGKIRSLPALTQKPVPSSGPIPRIPSLNSTPARSITVPERNTITADGVRLVAWDEPLDSTDDNPWKPQKHLITKAIRSMPRKTAHQFKIKIQNQLLNNCASCHDQRAQQMPLAKSSFGKTTPQWMTRQNLYSILLNTDTLIDKAVTAHGGQEKAAFAATDPFIAQLSLWVAVVTRQPLDLVQPTASPGISTTSKPPATIKTPAAAKPLTAPKKDAYDPSEFNRSR